MHLQKFLAEGHAHARSGFVQWQAHFFQQNFAGERVAVGMETMPLQSDNHIADFDFRTVEHFRPVYHTDNRSSDIVFPTLIHTGHLSGLTADEGAATVFAGLRKAFENLAEHHRVELFAADVIKEK